MDQGQPVGAYVICARDINPAEDYGSVVATVAVQGSPTIGQRLDRLPLTWTLWRLALVTQAGWAFVVLSDGIAARIYPFVLSTGETACLLYVADTLFPQEV